MQRKTKDAYTCVIRTLLEELGTTEIESVMADYENGLRAAVRDEIPGAELNGCWFHFSQAVVKKSKTLRLWQNEDIRKWIKMAAVLPLLPEDMIAESISIIEGQAPRTAIWRSFFTYIRNWQRKNISVFSKSMRTNNNIESFNRTIIRVAGRDHPNVWSVIEKLRLFESNACIETMRANNGASQPGRRKVVYKALDRKIQNAQNMLEGDGDILRFLQHMSHSTNLYVPNGICIFFYFNLFVHTIQSIGFTLKFQIYKVGPKCLKLLFGVDRSLARS